MSIYDLKIKNRNNEEVSLSDFKGKVLIIVNTTDINKKIVTILIDSLAILFILEFGDLLKLIGVWSEQKSLVQSYDIGNIL